MNSAAMFLFAAMMLRNPFWPIGYEGEREEISADPRVVVKAAPEAKDEKEETAKAQQETRQLIMERATSRNWAAARKSLRIGGTLRVGSGADSRQAVTINGNIYADGDLVSANVNGLRFTWRVKGLTETGTLRLQRIRMREIEEPSEDKGETK